jgi:hypothetical protein
MHPPSFPPLLELPEPDPLPELEPESVPDTDPSGRPPLPLPLFEPSAEPSPCDPPAPLEVLPLLEPAPLLPPELPSAALKDASEAPSPASSLALVISNASPRSKPQPERRAANTAAFAIVVVHGARAAGCFASVPRFAVDMVRPDK